MALSPLLFCGALEGTVYCDRSSLKVKAFEMVYRETSDCSLGLATDQECHHPIAAAAAAAEAGTWTSFEIVLMVFPALCPALELLMVRVFPVPSKTCCAGVWSYCSFDWA